MSGLPDRGPIADDCLKMLKASGIRIQHGRILQIGSFDELIKEKNPSDAVHEIEYQAVCLPGLIDSHTHICFGGSRAKDYAMRNSGKTYLEIAKEGGGIWDTVSATRASGSDELVSGILDRCRRHLNDGVTTIEVKSGYGLSAEEELKMLRSINSANKETKADLIATCLAAHIKPKDFEGDHMAYLEHLIQDLFPILSKEKLTSRIDAFVEEEAFGSRVTLPYLKKAQAYGWDVTLHADQFTSGGSELAVQVGAVSADHLEASGRREIERLASSEVIATALPGASMGLGCAFAPARKILDAGGRLAIASDWNPGSAPMGDLLLQAAVLGAFEKLSNAEILAGLTIRPASALGLERKGRLEADHLADLAVFPVDDYREILYNQGKLKPREVWKNGSPIPQD